MGIEDPDVDVAEQLQGAEPDDSEDPVVDPESLPSEADPADVAEQRFEVPDDDEYDR